MHQQKQDHAATSQPVQAINPARERGLELLEQLHGGHSGEAMVNELKDICPDFVDMTLKWALAGMYPSLPLLPLAAPRRPSLPLAAPRRPSLPLAVPRCPSPSLASPRYPSPSLATPRYPGSDGAVRTIVDLRGTIRESPGAK